MPKRRRAFDLFCGAGGSSWGATKAGVRIVGGVDLDPIALRTFKDNFASLQWAEAVPAETVDLSELAARLGRVDILLASPECTNHTHARGAAPVDEASREKAFQVVRYAQALAPRWVIVENVVNMEGWPAYDRFIGGLEKLGYSWAASKLDAANFGVPQRRRRLFVVFDREASPATITVARSPDSRPASEVVDLDGDYRWTLLRTPRRSENTIARADRAISALGAGVPFLIVYYGTDKAGGWQPLTVPLRTVTTVDRFAVVKWVDGEPHMRMLQPPELIRAMGLDAPTGRRQFRLRHGTRRDRIRLLGNAVCSPVMTAVVEALGE